uniref:Putative virion glycoprotein N-terminal domain-containing protein n=1 Tax=Xiangshan insect virus TaxID=2886242 RepID=A0A8K1P3H0_9VIRU|nr:MAG: hypothetical protein [Xiangshan insect virus]
MGIFLAILGVGLLLPCTGQEVKMLPAHSGRRGLHARMGRLTSRPIRSAQWEKFRDYDNCQILANNLLGTPTSFQISFYKVVDIHPNMRQYMFQPSHPKYIEWPIVRDNECRRLLYTNIILPSECHVNRHCGDPLWYLLERRWYGSEYGLCLGVRHTQDWFKLCGENCTGVAKVSDIRLRAKIDNRRYPSFSLLREYADVWRLIEIPGKDTQFLIHTSQLAGVPYFDITEQKFSVFHFLQGKPPHLCTPNVEKRLLPLLNATFPVIIYGCNTVSLSRSRRHKRATFFAQYHRVLCDNRCSHSEVHFSLPPDGSTLTIPELKWTPSTVQCDALTAVDSYGGVFLKFASGLAVTAAGLLGDVVLAASRSLYHAISILYSELNERYKVLEMLMVFGVSLFYFDSTNRAAIITVAFCILTGVERR